jgi:hypothetical protein
MIAASTRRGLRKIRSGKIQPPLQISLNSLGRDRTNFQDRIGATIEISSIDNLGKSSAHRKRHFREKWTNEIYPLLRDFVHVNS